MRARFVNEAFEKRSNATKKEDLVTPGLVEVRSYLSSEFKDMPIEKLNKSVEAHKNLLDNAMKGYHLYLDASIHDGNLTWYFKLFGRRIGYRVHFFPDRYASYNYKAISRKIAGSWMNSIQEEKIETIVDFLNYLKHEVLAKGAF